MWTCIKCGANNEDHLTSCPACGASRSAGRFSSAPVVRNAAAYSAPVRATPAPAVPAQTPQVQYIPDFKHIRAGRGFMALGVILTLMLATLTICFAVFRYDVFAPWLLGLFFTDAAAVSKVITLLVYVPVAALAVLLAVLPGLWTLAVGKALRRLARMEELL